MLSYRHAFHAGNHADVLKHVLLVQLIAYLKQKDTPFWFIDTHAGAGLYALDGEYAQKLAEYQAGIGRLWEREDVPAELKSYLDLVRALNPKGQLTAYPGSPWIASQLLREQDRLRLFELHPSEIQLLGENFRLAGRRVLVTHGDGFSGLLSLLPPPPRRALILIDPSYETVSDYRNVIKTLKLALSRFATGMYVVWYPVLSKPEALALPAKLKALGVSSWLDVSLSVRRRVSGRLGMSGSGLFVINPPWVLAGILDQLLPYLRQVLAEASVSEASFTLEHS